MRTHSFTYEGTPYTIIEKDDRGITITPGPEQFSHVAAALTEILRLDEWARELDEENYALRNRVISAEETAEADRRTSAKVFEQNVRLGELLRDAAAMLDDAGDHWRRYSPEKSAELFALLEKLRTHQ